MNITAVAPIRNEQDYAVSLARLEELMDRCAGSDEFDVLAVVLENYEETAYPISTSSPAAAMQFRLEQEASGYEI